MAMCWHQIPESRPSFSEIKSLLDELLGDRPDEYLDCGDPSAEVVPNLNSADNHEVNGDRHLRYSFLRESVSQRDLISSIAVQGYDRIADAHSAYGTLTVGGANNSTDTAASNNTAFAFNPLLAQIKSNPIPETYQHLPVIEPSPESAGSQYVNHETRPNRGGHPVIVKQDFRCGTENFVAQKL